MSEKLVSQRQELRGVGVSSGIGFGHARVMQTSSLQVPRYSVTAEDVDKEILMFPCVNYPRVFTYLNRSSTF